MKVNNLKFHFMFIRNNYNFILLSKLWSKLSTKNRKRIYIALSLILLSGICEFLSLAALLPFLNVLSNSEKYLSNTIFVGVTRLLNVPKTESSLYILLTLLFCFAVLLSSLVRLINLFFYNKTSALIGVEISSKIYRNVLRQNLEYYSLNDSSVVLATVTNFINDSVDFVRSSLQVVSSFGIILFISIGLFITNFFVAIISIGIFLPIYLYISKKTKKKVKSNSQKITNLKNSQIKQIQDSLGAIREILMHGQSKIYREIYTNTDYKIRIKLAQNSFLGTFPRYLLEGIGIILVALVALFSGLILQNDNAIITMLGLLALSIQKILPAMQFSYNNLTIMRNKSASFEEVIKLLELPLILENNIQINNKNLLFEEISLKNVSYKFPKTTKFVLKNLNFKFKKGQKIGIVGKTGSGKSTFIDILIGLLNPNSGEILVNNKNIHQSNLVLNSWMNIISHVPQNVFISNDTLENNIIFGYKENQINQKKLSSCIKVAQLSQFVKSLPNGVKTKLGESGAKISGGEKQRIAIARALYKGLQILILDESTSALDLITENSLLKSINNFDPNLTIIVIAHKTSSLSFCDTVIEIKNGKIESEINSGSILKMINNEN